MILARAFALSMLLVTQLAGAGGSLRVVPTRLDLPPDHHAAAVTVTNTGSVTTLLQLEPKRWSQQEGSDTYSTASELIVSPPIFTLDAGAEQVVRVARRDGSPIKGELAYRLFIQEVPTPASAAPREVSVVLRIGVPVFDTPASAVNAKLEWALRCQNGVAPVLIATNSGGRVMRIDELNVRAIGSDHIERAVYVLAGATRVFRLDDLPAGTRTVKLAARSGAEQIEASAACD
jgi:fimbrial chaperone protein